MNFAKNKFYIVVALLAGFLAVFLFCDSFKTTHHIGSEHSHEQQDVAHHQSMVLATLPSVSDNSLLQDGGLVLPSFFASLFQAVFSLQILMFTAALWLAWRVGKLCNYLFVFFCRGILNSKIYSF